MSRRAFVAYLACLLAGAGAAIGALWYANTLVDRMVQP